MALSLVIKDLGIVTRLATGLKLRKDNKAKKFIKKDK